MVAPFTRAVDVDLSWFLTQVGPQKNTGLDSDLPLPLVGSEKSVTKKLPLVLEAVDSATDVFLQTDESFSLKSRLKKLNQQVDVSNSEKVCPKSNNGEAGESDLTPSSGLSKPLTGKQISQEDKDRKTARSSLVVSSDCDCYFTDESYLCDSPFAVLNALRGRSRPNIEEGEYLHHHAPHVAIVCAVLAAGLAIYLSTVVLSGGGTVFLAFAGAVVGGGLGAAHAYKTAEDWRPTNLFESLACLFLQFFKYTAVLLHRVVTTPYVLLNFLMKKCNAEETVKPNDNFRAVKAEPIAEPIAEPVAEPAAEPVAEPEGILMAGIIDTMTQKSVIVDIRSTTDDEAKESKVAEFFWSKAFPFLVGATCLVGFVGISAFTSPFWGALFTLCVLAVTAILLINRSQKSAKTVGEIKAEAKLMKDAGDSKVEKEGRGEPQPSESPRQTTTSVAFFDIPKPNSGEAIYKKSPMHKPTSQYLKI